MLHTTNPVIKHKAGLLNLLKNSATYQKPVKSWAFSVIRFIVTANWSMKAVWMR
ncbi:hypothetical protein AI2994V1_4611 (plasmid) [Escherichia coli]|nr:hypothetical protein AI2994V1_4611 [Escherichia coli]